MNYFAPSELIFNEDNSIFHLHLQPEQVADKVILVGDPGRVSLVASHFDQQECDVQNREFYTKTGSYQGKRITVLSTGIGCDNIDIVLNELDALANIDFSTRQTKDKLRSLDIVRIGTCGGLQSNTPVGTFICSQKSIGFDGLLNFYAGRNEICDLAFETAFTNHMHWLPQLAAPYVIDADPELLARINQGDMLDGVTISSSGFYGPQGRKLRIPLADPELNAKICSFDYEGHKITNYEMEGSAIAGLSRLLGHKAMTVTMVVANRIQLEVNTSYKSNIDVLIQKVLERI
jgi:uridine phosphorylase